MLWDVRHEWPSGAHFTFNCYHHWATLVVQDTGDVSGQFLHSKEVMTHGGPLPMIAYAIGVLSLIRKLWKAHTRITQTCYADDAVTRGKFHLILAHLWDMQERGPPRK